MADCAGDIAAVLAELGITQVAVWGFSGGHTRLRVAEAVIRRQNRGVPVDRADIEIRDAIKAKNDEIKLLDAQIPNRPRGLPQTATGQVGALPCRTLGATRAATPTDWSRPPRT